MDDFWVQFLDHPWWEHITRPRLCDIPRVLRLRPMLGSIPTHLRFFTRNPLLHYGPPSDSLPIPDELCFERWYQLKQLELRAVERLYQFQ